MVDQLFHQIKKENEKTLSVKNLTVIFRSPFYFKELRRSQLECY